MIIYECKEYRNEPRSTKNWRGHRSVGRSVIGTCRLDISRLRNNLQRRNEIKRKQAPGGFRGCWFQIWGQILDLRVICPWHPLPSGAPGGTRGYLGSKKFFSQNCLKISFWWLFFVFDTFLPPPPANTPFRGSQGVPRVKKFFSQNCLKISFWWLFFVFDTIFSPWLPRGVPAPFQKRLRLRLIERAKRARRPVQHLACVQETGDFLQCASSGA